MARVVDQPIRHARLPKDPYELAFTDEEPRKFKFRDLSLNTKVVLAATSLSLSTYSVSFLYHYLGGGLLYYYEYLAAVVGYAEPSPACFRIKLAKDSGDRVDWFQLQRCLGNDLGLTRRGEPLVVIREIIQQLFAPNAAPGFILVCAA